MKFHDAAAAQFVVRQLQLEIERLRPENDALRQRLVELTGSAK